MSRLRFHPRSIAAFCTVLLIGFIYASMMLQAFIAGIGKFTGCEEHDQAKTLVADHDAD